MRDIRIPLLIAQDANDPRVKQAESEQIVDAFEAAGIEHEYLLFPDEGQASPSWRTGRRSTRQAVGSWPATSAVRPKTRTGEPASMIRRYIIWRNNHAYDERLRRIINRANQPDAAQLCDGLCLFGQVAQPLC